MHPLGTYLLLSCQQCHKALQTRCWYARSSRSLDLHAPRVGDGGYCLVVMFRKTAAIAVAILPCALTVSNPHNLDPYRLHVLLAVLMMTIAMRSNKHPIMVIVVVSFARHGRPIAQSFFAPIHEISHRARAIRERGGVLFDGLGEP